mgnify:CR=1 FL=1
MKNALEKNLNNDYKNRIDLDDNLKSKIKEHGTGHIHTAISVLEHRVKEVKECLEDE